MTDTMGKQFCTNPNRMDNQFNKNLDREIRVGQSSFLDHLMAFSFTFLSPGLKE